MDTNVVLDLWAFRNPACDALQMDVASGRVLWIATEAMRNELRRVLSDRLCSRWLVNKEQVLALVETVSEILPDPLPEVNGRMHCTDADDQMFIDLALSCGVRWLLTRDRALLKLRRRARLRGVDVCSPADWVRMRTSRPETM